MRIFSGLVLWVVLTITALALVLLFLDPSSWPVALVALAFLPLAGFILRTTGRMVRMRGTPRSNAAVRASLVGGGALLISALGTRIAEAAGWIGAETNGRSLVSIVFVLVIVAGDFMAVRMQKDRESDHDHDGE